MSKLKKIIKHSDEIAFVFEGGTEIKMGSVHKQDCCEEVYADFSILELHKDKLIGKEFQSLEVRGVAEEGFLIRLRGKHGWDEWTEKIFIPCYDIQNGYYSNDLTLNIQVNDAHVEKIDISKLSESLEK